MIVAWHPATGRCCFASIGDSRLYLVADAAAHSLTEDDACGVVLKRGGRVILKDGTVAFSRALTRALGQTEPLKFPTGEVDVAPGSMLVLATDGCHELPGFARDLLEVQRHFDLAAAAQDLIGARCRDDARDHATAILMRDTRCPDELHEQIVADLQAGGPGDGPGRYGHIVVSVIMDEMVRRARSGDMAGLQQGLQALTSSGLKPRRQDALAVIDAMSGDGAADAVRIHRQLVYWAARL